MADKQRSPDASSRRRRSQPQRKRRRRKVLVTCPHCETRFEAVQLKKRYLTPCLSCDQAVVVEKRRESTPQQEEPDRSKKSSRRRRSRNSGVYQAAVEIREEEPPEIKPPSFVSAVVFPWHPDVFMRWLYISVGCSVFMFLFVLINWCMSLGGGLLTRAAFALMFPFFWISLFTLSYIAACGTPIVAETSHGSERVGGWPEPDWLQWISDLLFYVPAISCLASVSYGVAHMVSLNFDHFALAFLASILVLLPIVLLSVFDSNSSLSMVSPSILFSMFLKWPAWTMFYAMTVALAVVWPGAMIYFYEEYPFESAFGAGPLMAAVIVIYARLLGCLGFHVGQIERPDDEDE